LLLPSTHLHVVEHIHKMTTYSIMSDLAQVIMCAWFLHQLTKQIYLQTVIVPTQMIHLF